MNFTSSIESKSYCKAESLGCVLVRSKGQLAVTGLKAFLELAYGVFIPRRDVTVMKQGNLPERGTGVSGEL